jgi:hypothetical protein
MIVLSQEASNQKVGEKKLSGLYHKLLKEFDQENNQDNLDCYNQSLEHAKWMGDKSPEGTRSSFRMFLALDNKLSQTQIDKIVMSQ